MYKSTKRNFDNIQFAELRKKIDGKFNEIHDELTACYYDYWKHEKSKLFISGGKTYDVQDTPEKSKQLFDKLHGLIFTVRDVKFHQENLRQLKKDRIPEEKYNEEMDENGNVIGKKVDKAIQEIARLKNEGLEINI